MNPLSTISSEEISTLREQWEIALKAELKLDQIESKVTKKSPDLGAWPVLSTEAPRAHYLGGQTSWKKASQSYVRVPTAEQIREDLQSGVQIFFLHQMTGECWKTLEAELGTEHEVFLLGDLNFTSDKFSVIRENGMILARNVHEQGGTSVLELATIAQQFTRSLQRSEWVVGVFLDSKIFQSVAKVRAVRLLAQKIQLASEVSIPLRIVGLNSYRDWTLFERYSNMLRNNAQVTAGYLSGADVVQSSGYQLLFDLETDLRDQEHDLRSQRMGRNTAHILALESMLGIVEDPSFGSYHLEGLTEKLAQESWQSMQKLLGPGAEQWTEQELATTREQRLERMKMRRDVQAGINDYPDLKESLDLIRRPSLFRPAAIFEELRLRASRLKHLPVVEIKLLGDYAALNSRLNFIKNYFELLGLRVIDPLHPESASRKIVVLCAADADYSALAESVTDRGIASYVAGKVSVEGYTPIFSGQNVYEVLHQLLEKLESLP